MTEPTRRRLEQPSEERQKRNGCLIWGGVLGVLAGIMVGVYALPPILKSYYGETNVAADEFYRGDGKVIRVDSIGQASDPLGDVNPGMRRFDFFVSVVVVAEKEWRPKFTDFSLEFSEIEDWQQAAAATTGDVEGISVPAGMETSIQLHFAIQLPRDDADQLTPDALHLSDPRVRFDIE